MAIKWTAELEMGIPVIDAQHRRIVDYINSAEHIQKTKNPRELGGVV